MQAPKPKGDILVVDDNPHNLRLLQTLLTDHGYNVRPVPDGKLALSGAKAIPPDLILLDIGMPEMDGYEVCRQLKESAKTRNIPVIFLTAKTADDDALAGFELGAADYVTKPFNATVLLARVDTHVTLRKKTKQLEEISMKDGLTQIANRRYFDEFLDSEWRRCLREQKPISLMLIDIDHFKLFNDTYGHQKGDEALKQVANVIDTRKGSRSGDLAARYGGEEFAVILGSTVLDDAKEAASAIRVSIEELAIPHESSDTRKVLTASIGLTTVVPDSQAGVTSLAKQADVFLYQAKTGGRNRVEYPKET